jgi:hypothetical protein
MLCEGIDLFIYVQFFSFEVLHLTKSLIAERSANAREVAHIVEPEEANALCEWSSILLVRS